jgi:Holliday junction resolvase-like predicted endonuclease
MRPTEIDRSIRVVVPRAWENDQKGAFLERLAAGLLRRQSYDVLERVRFTGMEIDVLATHKPSGDRVYVECKFHERPLSANVLDLMVGQGMRKRISRFALFSTTPLVKEALGALEELRSDERLSFAWYGPDQMLEALQDSGHAPPLPTHLPASISHATLLVHPEYYLWLLQEQSSGRPFQIVVCGHPQTEMPSTDEVRALLDEFGILDGLPIAHLSSQREGDRRASLQSTRVPTEVVSSVGTADDLIDYRPCRPEFFVGRVDLQRAIIKFLGQVRDGQTATRLIALVGASGFGKSSLVAKLAQRLRNLSWRSKFYMYPIDVRSARGSLFVGESILTALRAAALDNFFRFPLESLAVEDADNVLSSESIADALAALERQGKVLVIFFDQFEEALTKDELAPLFRAFRRFALDVHAKKAPLVVGFSWRTGISFSDDNPAYQMWNELRDHRLSKTLGFFDSAESSSVISQFESALSEKFIPPLRRRLLEQGQGLPWLLKKLCIHVYTQISERKVSQLDLVGARLNVSALFDEDLEHLSSSQKACLRYIASNSPADSLDVYDRFGSDATDSLVERRLVIRAGQRFAVYWDIFRDYLNEGSVPFIPLTYIPNTTISMALLACETLRKTGPLTTSALASNLGYSESTIINIVTDLQNLAICSKDADGRNCLVASDVAEQVRSQFVDHVVYQRLLAASSDGVLSRDRAGEVVIDLYAGNAAKQETRANYLTRLVPWFEYAGLVDASGRTLRVLPPNRPGPRFGRLPSRGRVNRNRVFLGSAPPDSVISLADRLQKEGRIAKSEVAGKLRNSAADLVALQLAFWTSECLQFDGAVDLPPANLVRITVESDATMLEFCDLAKQNIFQNRMELGAALGAVLERDWKQSSALRYANGLMAYAIHFRLLPDQ